MKNVITVVTDNNDFFKQISQIFPLEIVNNGLERVYPGSDLSQARMIVSDGCDKSIYDEDVPTFVIAEEFPANVRESASVRFYKKGAFSPEIFAKDVSEWIEIITALEEASNNEYNAEKKQEEYKQQMAVFEADLQSSHELQQSVMIPKTLEGFDVACFYKAMAKVSGDILLMEEIGDKIYIVIGDVTDHGYLAGVYGASLFSSIKSYLALTSQFGLNLEGLVRFIQHASSFYQPDGYDSLRQKTSATMLFCEINKKEQMARFINCGHGNELPIIIDENNKAQLIEVGHMLPVIGDFTVIPPLGSVCVPFTQGSCLIFYTDGITEIFKDINDKDIENEYSTERLLSSVKDEIKKKNWNANSILEGIKKDAKSYCISTELSQDILNDDINGLTDDATVLVLRWEQNNDR